MAIADKKEYAQEQITLQVALKDTEYKLTQFSEPKIKAFEKTITSKPGKSVNKLYANCLVRKKEIQLTPEEIVRQVQFFI